MNDARYRTADLSDRTVEGVQIFTVHDKRCGTSSRWCSGGDIWSSPTRSYEVKQKYKTNRATTTHPRYNSTLFTLIKNSIKRHIRFVGFLKCDAWIVYSVQKQLTS
jgi:hypothetical protein